MKTDASFQNLCDLHRRTAARLGDAVALRFKRHGAFQNLTWSQYRREADRAAAGLLSLGVQPGDHVALLSENRYEWLIADHAMLSAAAATVPLHAPVVPRQVAHQVGHSEAVGVIVSSQAQADKLWQVLPQLPRVRFVISFEPVAPGSIETLGWEELLARGDAHRDAAAELAVCESRLAAADLATVIYTSGTTGNPKGVMLTHGNLLSNAAATHEVMNLGPGDVLLSWLPYSHIYARTVDHYLTTISEITLVLSTLDDLIDDLKTIRPTWVTAVPRFYEKVWSSVEDRAEDDRGQALRDVFGPQLRHLTSGGGPLPRSICERFHEAGLPLLEGYGLTESSPVISFNRREAFRIGTVGRAIPGVDVKIADDGEILTRGPHVMRGYFKDHAATRAAIDADGWLLTGDIGTLDDDGYLSITDRKKDLIITAGGKNIAPTEIERLLVGDPLIDQAVVYGDGRPYVVAILVPSLEELKRQLNAAETEWSVRDGFIDAPAVLSLLEQRVASIMQSVSQPERVRKFLVRSRPFQLGDDELTATLKVRRRFIIGKYESRLAQLYEQSPSGCDSP